MSGKITVFTGPMSSGKTTALLNCIERYNIREVKAALFKPSIDQRYAENKILTHNKRYEFSCINISNAKDILLHKDDYAVFGIDEAMMLDSELIEVCHYLRAHGKKVYLSTLDMDYLMNPFMFNDAKRSIGDLLAIANEVKKFQAVCTQRDQKGLISGTDAHYTKRTSTSTNLLEVGGLESYTPVSLRFHPSLEKLRKLYN